MPTPIRGFRLPVPLVERIDAARGSESRTSWLVRACEAQLERGVSDARELDGLRNIVESAQGSARERIAASLDGPLGPVSSFDAKAGVVPR